MYSFSRLQVVAAVAALVVASATTAASANPFNPFEALFGPQRQPVTAPAYANPQDDANEPRSELRRQIVNYRTSEAPAHRGGGAKHAPARERPARSSNMGYGGEPLS